MAPDRADNGTREGASALGAGSSDPYLRVPQGLPGPPASFRRIAAAREMVEKVGRRTRRPEFEVPAVAAAAVLGSAGSAA